MTGGIKKIKATAEAMGLPLAQVAATGRKETHRKGTATKKQAGKHSSKVAQDKAFAEYVMGEVEWAKYLATPTGNAGWEGEKARRPMSNHHSAAACRDRKKQIKMLGVKGKRDKKVVTTLKDWTFTTDAAPFVDQDTRWSMEDNVEWTSPDGAATFIETMAAALSIAYWAHKNNEAIAAAKVRKQGKQPKSP